MNRGGFSIEASTMADGSRNYQVHLEKKTIPLEGDILHIAFRFFTQQFFNTLGSILVKRDFISPERPQERSLPTEHRQHLAYQQYATNLEKYLNALLIRAEASILEASQRNPGRNRRLVSPENRIQFNERRLEEYLYIRESVEFLLELGREQILDNPNSQQLNLEFNRLDVFVEKRLEELELLQKKTWDSLNERGIPKSILPELLEALKKLKTP